MSYSSLEKTLDRVRVASKESPIAILKTTDSETFETLFAATQYGKIYIEENKDRLVGIYHKDGIKPRDLKRELTNV